MFLLSELIITKTDATLIFFPLYIMYFLYLEACWFSSSLKLRILPEYVYLILFSNLPYTQWDISTWKTEYTFTSEKCFSLCPWLPRLWLLCSHLDFLQRFTRFGLHSSTALTFSLITFIFLNHFIPCHRAVSQYGLLIQYLKSYQGPCVNHSLGWTFKV